jgi:Nitrate reductase delta subunit
MAQDSGAATPSRWELLRALGAVAGDHAGARTACSALGLPSPSRGEHTVAFAINCPPYAPLYLGAGGGIGGDAADRVAGFWRVIGIAPPAEPDHLTALLSLYASLGEAGTDSATSATADALTRARHTLFWEHIWPWVPGYLDAVARLRSPSLAAWALVARRALLGERRTQPGSWLPLALRDAPPPVAADGSLGDFLTGLTAPARCGFILTRDCLAAGSEAAGTGFLIGERRFTLSAMLEQRPAETLGWLSCEAARWSRRHARQRPGDHAAAEPADIVQQWWARRADHTQRVLRTAAAA